jgi:hypothetical protein
MGKQSHFIETSKMAPKNTVNLCDSISFHTHFWVQFIFIIEDPTVTVKQHIFILPTTCREATLLPFGETVIMTKCNVNWYWYQDAPISQHVILIVF